MVLCDLTDAKNCVFHGKRGEEGERGREEGGRGESNELNLSNGKYIFVGAERILFFFFIFFFITAKSRPFRNSIRFLCILIRHLKDISPYICKFE